jgi:regulator of protease activity HflC (stomatin/prohibitin superfamily)
MFDKTLLNQKTVFEELQGKAMWVIVPLGLVLAGTVVSSGCKRVRPGYVGVKSTVVGEDRGLQDAAVGPAWVFFNPLTESVFEYPTFVRTAIWTANRNEGRPVNEEITFTVRESLEVAADISLAYSLRPEKVPAFYLKFRSDDIDLFTHGFLRNLARQCFDDVAGRYSVDQVMGDNGPFLREVRESLQKALDPMGVRLEQFGFVGSPRPPAAVIASIQEKVKATQIAIQKENEVRQAQADAQKTIAEAEGDARATLTRAEAQAEANRKLSASLTPTLVQYRMIDKWNGVMPTVQSGQGSGLLMALPQAK